MTRNNFFLIICVLCQLIFIPFHAEGRAVAKGRDTSGLFPSIALGDNFNSVSLGTRVAIAEDKSAVLTIEQVRSGSAEELVFKKSEKNVPHFLYTDSAIWVRFEIENVGSSLRKWFLEIGYPLLDRVDFYYYVNNGSLNHSYGGDTFPFDQRSIDYRNITFPIELQAGDRADIYLRVSSKSSMQIPMILWTVPAFISAKNTEQIVYGFLFGLIIVMVLYNFILYFPTRELTYLYYVAYMGNGAVLLSALTGYGYQYFWPNSVWWHNHSIPFIIMIWIPNSVLFSRVFLNFRVIVPNFDKVMKGLIYLPLGLVIPSLVFNLQLMTRVSASLSIVAAVLTTTAGFVTWKRGFQAARFFVLAWVIFCFGIVTYALKSLGLLSSNLITNHAINVGIAIEAVFIALALGDSINTLRREKAAAVASEMAEQRSRLSKLIHITQLAENLANVANDMTDSMVHLSVSSNKVADAVSSANRTAEEIDTATKAMDENVGRIAAASTARAEDWRRGYNAIVETGEAIHRINTESNRIAMMTQTLFSKLEEMDRVITQVHTVSEQSKILAVNASIEAANAGELGRGFGVIAREVGQLSGESARATVDVTELLVAVRGSLEKIVSATQTGKVEADGTSQIVDEVRELVEGLAKGIRDNATQANEVSNTINKQTFRMADILNSLKLINTTANQNLFAIDKMTDASNNVRASAERLRTLAEEWSVTPGAAD